MSWRDFQRAWWPMPRENTGDADPTVVGEDRAFWTERHWVAPALYSADQWYANELVRLEDRAPA